MLVTTVNKTSCEYGEISETTPTAALSNNPSILDRTGQLAICIYRDANTDVLTTQIEYTGQVIQYKWDIHNIKFLPLYADTNTITAEQEKPILNSTQTPVATVVDADTPSQTRAVIIHPTNTSIYGRLLGRTNKVTATDTLQLLPTTKPTSIPVVPVNKDLVLWTTADGAVWNRTNQVFRFARDNINAMNDFLKKYALFHPLRYTERTHVNTDGHPIITCGLYGKCSISGDNDAFHGPVTEYWAAVGSIATTRERVRFTGWYSYGEPQSGTFYDRYGVVFVRVTLIDKGYLLPAYVLKMGIGDPEKPTRFMESKISDLITKQPDLGHKGITGRDNFVEHVMRAFNITYKSIMNDIYALVDPQLAVNIIVQDISRLEESVHLMECELYAQRNINRRNIMYISGILMIMCFVMLTAISYRYIL